MDDLGICNRFIQHIPGFVDGCDPLRYDFSTTQELLDKPLFKRATENPKFSHFAMSDNCIMEITDDGFHWWVLGTIEKPELVDLPTWAGWKHRAIMDGEEVVLTNEVVSSCGDVLTLRDGRKAQALK